MKISPEKIMTNSVPLPVSHKAKQSQGCDSNVFCFSYFCQIFSVLKEMPYVNTIVKPNEHIMKTEGKLYHFAVAAYKLLF
jgi:hypothetical protein